MLSLFIMTDKERKEKTAALFKAVHDEKGYQIRTLLKPTIFGDRIDINVRNINGETLVYEAAKRGLKRILKLLFEYNPDVNIPDILGDTPLIKAAKINDVDTMQLLIEKGADIHIETEFGTNAFFEFLTGMFHFKDFKKVVDFGVDLFKRNRGGDTPFEYYAKYNKRNYYFECIKVERFFVERGANPNVLEHSGEKNLLDIALEYNDKEIEEHALFLIEHGAVLHKTKFSSLVTNGKTKIINALIEKGCKLDAIDLSELVSMGENKLVETIIKQGANPDSCGISGMTATMVAAKKGDVDLLKYLVQSGADVNAVNNNGVSVMTYAAEGGRVAVVEFLESKGVDIHCVDKKGQTPLVVAAENQKTDVINYLAAKGVDINTQLEDGDTACIRVARKGYLGVVKQLTELGADISIENKAGETAYLAAAYNRQKEVIKYFNDMGLIQYKLYQHRQSAEDVVEKELRNRTIEQLIDLPNSEPSLWHKTIALKKLSVVIQLLPESEHYHIYKQARNMLKPDEKEELKEFIRSRRGISINK